MAIELRLDPRAVSSHHDLVIRAATLAGWH